MGSIRGKTLVAFVAAVGVALVAAASADAKLTVRVTEIAGDAGEVEYLQAHCPGKRIAVSSGFTAEGFNAAFNPYPLTSQRAPRRGYTRWNNAGDGGLGLQTRVVCGGGRRFGKIRERSKNRYIDPGQTMRMRVICPRGRRAVSGGFSMGNLGMLLESRMHRQRGWIFTARHRGKPLDLPIEVAVSVYCLPRKKAPKLTRTSATTPVEGGGDAAADVLCPASETLVSGGVRGSFDLDAGTYAVLPFAAMADASTGAVPSAFRVRGYSPGVAGSVRAWAYCASGV